MFTSILRLFLLISLCAHFDVRSTGFASSTVKWNVNQLKFQDDLDTAASEIFSPSNTSHRIITHGWPSTSAMWPSILTEESSSGLNTTNWLGQVEPFIYVDRTRATDYSLLLELYEGLLEKVKELEPHNLNLSFEYYFNFNASVTNLPLIKIEVDRKTLVTLEPNGKPVKPRIWTKFNMNIAIDQKQYEIKDWLKLSFVIREDSSLVAVRRLVVTLEKRHDPRSSYDGNPNTVTTQSSSTPIRAPALTEQAKIPTPDGQRNPLPTPIQPISPSPQQTSSPIKSTPPPVESKPNPEHTGHKITPEHGRSPNKLNVPASTRIDKPLQPDQSHNHESDHFETGTHQVPPTNLAPHHSANIDHDVAASDDILSTKIVPVPSRQNASIWNSLLGRKKRDTSESKSSNRTQPTSYIQLICERSDSCEWRPDGDGEIKWSLARMPPSTEKVQLGYSYVSNRKRYGDASKILRLYVNQTDSATSADLNSDHCIDLALYITEKVHLKLYSLIWSGDQPLTQDSAWVKDKQLISWAPTTLSIVTSNSSQANQRGALPHARLASMEQGQNGWTLERLCFGDFFVNARECVSAKCAFGFEMGLDSDTVAYIPDDKQVSDSKHNPEVSSLIEQVVGVAPLREFTNETGLRPHSRWLSAWQSDRVSPSRNWRFFPEQDFSINTNNVSLLNLYDGAKHQMYSDWFVADPNLDLTGVLAIEFNQASPTNSLPPSIEELINKGDSHVFKLHILIKLLSKSYKDIVMMNQTIEWSLAKQHSETYSLGASVSEHLPAAARSEGSSGEELFKLVMEFSLDCPHLTSDSPISKALAEHQIDYRFSVANISLSDRCHPNPCLFGSCEQNGTGRQDWTCHCDEKHRGRECQFGKWCELEHVTWPPAPNRGQGQVQSRAVVQAQSKNEDLITGNEFCRRKLGSKTREETTRCTDLEVPLDEQKYFDEGFTFRCSCLDNFYQKEDQSDGNKLRCALAHQCNSVVCPSIGMICDETVEFDKNRPCVCNEKDGWFMDEKEKKCVRNQCRDKMKDCGFDAHICLPTLPKLEPICKCGPKFSLVKDKNGKKSCQSTACVLPSLNDCQQICLPDDSNLKRPYTCACHPGYVLDDDGRSCKPQRQKVPKCIPECKTSSQICTDRGCRCKQGHVAEKENEVDKIDANGNKYSYVRSVSCLNMCSLSYSENKEAFETLETVCPLGLCDARSFQCSCANSSSMAAANNKYEPIYAEVTADSPERRRSSPLCQLRRICEPGSDNYNFCTTRGAICVPDYTKPMMFDCICPQSTSKRVSPTNETEFNCEPLCSSIRGECLRKQAVCRVLGKGMVDCDCLPGFMFDQKDQKCYLARYSYTFNLVLVNKYYEPESKFHVIHELDIPADESVKKKPLIVHHEDHEEPADDLEASHVMFEGRTFNTSSQHLAPISHHHNKTLRHTFKTIFIADYNQCNITEILPKYVRDDPYEHDMESFLNYIDQCNQKLHQQVRNYRLNSNLSVDISQSLKQYILEPFTVITRNSSCYELDPDGMLLNCTVYIQSNKRVEAEVVNRAFSNCAKNGFDKDTCWIKPRLLLKADRASVTANPEKTEFDPKLNFHQFFACELDNFCGPDAYPERLDDKTSLCSCICKHDVDDVKDLISPKLHENSTKIAVKQICVPRNLCYDTNFCANKTNSKCHYDVKKGSECKCIYPYYEDTDKSCIEYSIIHSYKMLTIIITMLIIGLIGSVAINLIAIARSRRIFGKRSAQYPLNEFPSARNINRSTGIPNLSFEND